MQIVFEYEDDISDGTVYYYGLNRTHNSNGEIYVYNAHGDTVQLVKDNAVTVSYTYDAFGNLTSQVGESDNHFLYCSEYFDEETETYYLRARYYNPANGRFTQQDAWAFMDTSDPLSLNLYTYCCNNPAMYVDPSGHVIKEIKEYLKALFQVGKEHANFGFIASLKAKKVAISFAETNELYEYVHINTPIGVVMSKKHNLTGNRVDAYRHMIWNYMMARDIGALSAQIIADNHEREYISSLGWIDSESEGIIVTKLNQPTLMDLWNNYTGRTLAGNLEVGTTYDEVFQYAENGQMLLTDENVVYETMGIDQYKNEDYTVNAIWNINLGTIVFVKDGLPNVTRTIGDFSFVQ